MTRESPGETRYLVLNGGEDEPGSKKDRVLLGPYGCRRKCREQEGTRYRGPAFQVARINKSSQRENHCREFEHHIARDLLKAGLIRSSRGRIAVLSRSRLEARACECYRLLRGETDRLVRDVYSAKL